MCGICRYKRKRKVAKGKKVRRDIRLPTLGIHIQAYLMRQLIVSFITIMWVRVCVRGVRCEC